MARARGRLGALMVGAVLAACTGGDDDAADATSSTSAAVTSTTVVVTSTSAPTAAPAGQVVIADRFLVGWWDGAAWQPAAPFLRGSDDPEVPLELGSSYTFVSIDGRRVDSELGTSTSECIDPGPAFVDVPDDVTDMVGVPAGVEPWPRPIGEIAPAAAHEDSVRTWLEGEGVANANVAIDRVTRTDLQGDGTDEVFIEANDIHDPSLLGNSSGAYSVVLVRTIVGSEVQTASLAGDVVTEEEATATDFGGFIETFELVAIADLEGDGVLEVVVRSAYYEGGGVRVFAWDGDSLEEVVGAGCGA